MRLMWMPLKSKPQIAVSSECCRRLSCGSKSDTVVPRAWPPRVRIAPACSSSVSTSEVLPAPACPTSAMLRMPAVVYPMADAPRQDGPAPHERHRYRKSLLHKGCLRLLAARTMQGKMSDSPPDEARKRRAWQKIQRQLDEALEASFPASDPVAIVDRKSTRLNSSHSQISYAVFCLKKQKHQYHSLDTQDQDIYTLPAAGEAKDPYTVSHTKRCVLSEGRILVRMRV